MPPYSLFTAVGVIAAVLHIARNRGMRRREMSTPRCGSTRPMRTRYRLHQRKRRKRSYAVEVYDLHAMKRYDLLNHALNIMRGLVKLGFA